MCQFLEPSSKYIEILIEEFLLDIWPLLVILGHERHLPKVGQD